jgi:hypothetical protein
VGRFRKKGGGLSPDVLAISIAFILIGCAQSSTITGEFKKTANDNGGNPVSISFDSGKNGSGIESYSADVTVQTGNSRIANSERVAAGFRISTKIIDGSLRTRIDYSKEQFPDLRARTMITDGTEAVLFFSDNLSVDRRISFPDAGESIPLLTSNRIMGRVPYDQVITEMNKLSFKITKDPTNSLALFEAPTEILKKIGSEKQKISALRIFYDMAQETLKGSETVEQRIDEEIVTTDTSFYYQMVDEQPVLIGQVIEEKHDVAASIDMSGSMLPQNINPDEIPTISEEELESLRQQGLAFDYNQQTGDLSDPDYTNTTITTYDNIKINQVRDTDMRVVFDGGK